MQEWALQKGDSAWTDSMHQAPIQEVDACRGIQTASRRLSIDKGVPCLTPTFATASPRLPLL